ncbi:MAG: amino acid adenylation domain-containing protein [Candidatus Cloacimonetes bacterium]|nr:amino acid adenylation domain-containing protein [Candidatus Cloacimonadota bacterium]
MKVENIEDSYKLSPAQQGMLFHTLYAPKSGVYIEQLSCTIYGNLNTPAFKAAWQKVSNRHPVLRTSFYWEDTDKSLQLVHQRVQLPMDKQDWRGLSLREQKKRIKSFLQSDREQGFDISLAPLMRLTLIRIAEDVYQFIWSYHYILLDGWSSHLVLKEIFALYEAFCQGQDLHLVKPHPYKDYISWLQKQDLSKAEIFWRKTLKGFNAPTPFVKNKISLNVSKKEEYKEQEVILSNTINSALLSFVSQHNLTINTLVQGAWALLINRYIGEEDVVFGTTISAHQTDLDHIKSMIGLFINTLPVRVKVEPEDSILSWLKKIENYQVELQKYVYSPLVKVQGWSDVPRGLQLFESILDFDNYHTDNFSLKWGTSVEGLEIRNMRIFSRTNYPLTLIIEREPQLTFRLLYDCFCFDTDTITRMLGHFRTILEGMVANPKQSLEKLPMLTNTEHQQLLVKWNDTVTDYIPCQCVHKLFEVQVEKTPEDIALIFKNSHLTFRELNKRSNQLANYLQKLGVGPDVLVGIYIGRSVEMIVGLLAILKAGGTCVALDLLNPEERLEFMIKDSQLKVLMTHKSLLENISSQKCTKIYLDSERKIITNESDKNTKSNVTIDNIMYAIYTSGSTGKPKCAGITHRIFLNLLNWQYHHSNLAKQARTVQFAIFGFCVSFQEIFSTLCSGSTLVLISEDEQRDIAGLPKFLENNAIERLHLPFVALKHFAEIISTKKQLPTKLREIITAGEQLQVTDSIRSLFERNPNCSLNNHYGTSEIHVVSSFTLSNSPKNWSKNVPIGRPIDNIQFYVLDSFLRPVPIGVPGELYVAGSCIGPGYLNNPELTAEKFIPDPFSKDTNARLFKTGDRVRYLSDGNVEFLGRMDYLIKIRGFRIEPGEVETVLSQHPDVEESVVKALNDASGERYLVAYIVPNQETEPAIIELRNYLKKKLPEYMVPFTFMMLDALPLTPTGKVDRQALPVPEKSHRDIEKTFIAPRTLNEEKLAKIWAVILKLDKVGVHDNFFELGGHSLLAVQVVSRIRNIFQVEIPLRNLFEAPTVAGLAKQIEMLIELSQPLQTSPTTNVDEREEIKL